jgi:hypothetical protein
MKAMHVVTQDNQPYGSVRKCCERCGTAIWNIELYVDNKHLYTEKIAKFNKAARCIDLTDSEKKRKTMTPNDIEILIHCHTTPLVHPRIDAPAVKESLEMMESHNLIYQEILEEYYLTTDKGKAYIAMLCNTPMPEQVWVDESNNVINY